MCDLSVIELTALLTSAAALGTIFVVWQADIRRFKLKVLVEFVSSSTLEARHKTCNTILVAYPSRKVLNCLVAYSELLKTQHETMLIHRGVLCADTAGRRMREQIGERKEVLIRAMCKNVWIDYRTFLTAYIPTKEHFARHQSKTGVFYA